MRIALISDLHGNLEALTAVVDDIRECACDDVRCLGDVVGYGPDPDGCVELTREVATRSLLGNHDAAAIGTGMEGAFSPLASAAIAWTRRQLSSSSLRYLQGLPFTDTIGNVLLAHAHPVDPRRWFYLFVGEDLSAVFQRTTAELMVVGHTHVGSVGNDREGTLAPFREGMIELQVGNRYVFNVGSVGQPRDGDARAAWAILDTDRRTYEARRVVYDVDRVQRKMRERGLPETLAQRLAGGR